MSVTDADREAYAALLRELGREGWEIEDARSGIDDDDAGMVIVAAHRTRAHAEGYEAAVRDVVAWLRQRRAMPITSKYIALQIEAGAFKP